MSSIGPAKWILEMAKFAVYVTVPVALTYAFVTDSGTLHKLMGFKPYVVYPPEGPPPPSPEELREMARQMARNNKSS
ncbi:uncharacterized protein LOC110031791 [Phalaenopsis equestris]|uniref:uncharacterized protein LOC110031791 n=1 Tax=Phalaenopsis equestris TaxID=78828 RepID=UPI0009E2A915|nr:uncharacterized protein LOC110031791 [Phalaenopsis equestris]